MNCKQSITHIVREGDSFYTIAGYYQIPVEVMIEQNPGMDPYNLQVGTELTVCLDSSPAEEGMWEYMDWGRIMDLSNEMRQAWEQHIYWTRMLLLSIVARMQDQTAVTDRLMRNPMDIARVYQGFLPQEAINQIAGLLTQHLQIGGQLMTAMRDGQQAEAEQLLRQWYANADQIVAALAAVNPQYHAEELRNLLYRHLELLTQQIAARVAGNYQADIRSFDEGEDHILMMADYLTSGLVQQFPQNFQ